MSDETDLPAAGPSPRPLTAVVAMTPEGVIGLDGDMPWRLRSDLRRFKSLTMGGWLIMGRKTFDTIGRPLPGRQTLVLTRNRDLKSPGVAIAHHLQDALRMTESAPAFVVGGAEIYKLLWPHCGRVFLTKVWANLNGDTRLDVNFEEFTLIEQMRVIADASDSFPTEFCSLVRR